MHPEVEDFKAGEKGAIIPHKSAFWESRGSGQNKETGAKLQVAAGC